MNMALREFFWVNEYLLSLVAYLLFFLLFPYFINRHWYKQNPEDEFDNKRDKKELIKNMLEEHKFLEHISYVLSGSALLGLTFIITINYENLNVLEPVITFFAIGFILEIISAFSFRDLTTNFWGQFGTVFQYGGIISILMGFEVFIFSQEELNWSLILQAIFPIGMTFIVYLTGKQLESKIKFLSNIKRLQKKKKEDKISEKSKIKEDKEKGDTND